MGSGFSRSLDDFPGTLTRLDPGPSTFAPLANSFLPHRWQRPEASSIWHRIRKLSSAFKDLKNPKLGPAPQARTNTIGQNWHLCSLDKSRQQPQTEVPSPEPCCSKLRSAFAVQYTADIHILRNNVFVYVYVCVCIYIYIYIYICIYRYKYPVDVR